MGAHYQLPRLPSERGFRVETSRGPRFDSPNSGELDDGLVDFGLEWLWPGRIPMNRLSLIEGPPDSGKSFAALSIAAIASAGTPWPDGPQGPAAYTIHRVPDTFFGQSRQTYVRLFLRRQNPAVSADTPLLQNIFTIL